jgi:Protein kinase domain
MDDAGFYTISHPEYFETLSRWPIQPDYLEALQSALPPHWKVVRSDIWLHAGTKESLLPAEGFKIHLSCRMSDALTMLKRFVPICAEMGVQFKIAADPMLHTHLNSKRYARGGSGKFATIYPPNHDSFAAIIRRLHEATKDLQGPYILSDKRYSGSKVVFYRWGGFQRVRRLRPDGIQRMMVHAPDGNLVVDDRTPYFRLPAWVQDPFPDDEEENVADSELLHGRYKVEKALAFTNTGGVYLAKDQESGLKVVIKEARPGTVIWGPRKVCVDSIIVLKNEYAALERLRDLSCVPQRIELYQEWEHTFLVQTYFDGMPLANFRALEGVVIMSRMDDPQAIIHFCHIWRQICIRLLDAVGAIHARDVIIGDISPGNVLIRPQTRELALIDFEGALLASASQEITHMGTQWCNPGFRKPESRQAAALSPFDDFYACGMLLYNLVCPIQSLFELDRNHPVFRILDHFVKGGLPAQIREIIGLLLEGDSVQALAVAESWQLPAFSDEALAQETELQSPILLSSN